jgi:prepilin-type N-terminal cleavage/methylation domain-containing protein
MSQKHSSMKGFTLIELLISVLIFTLVVLAIYFFFDQGQWLYLQSQKRASMQENARLCVEQMERDFRMIGAGVPKGTNITTAKVWTPSIFAGTKYSIGFTGDLDNGSLGLTADVGSIDATHIFIGVPPNYYKAMDPDNDNDFNPDLPIVLDTDRSQWKDLMATTLDTASLITTTPVPSPEIFKANISSVHTLERVFYRMVNQAGIPVNDTVCNDSYPFCTIERQEFMTNNPDETDPETEAAGAQWVTVATNATILDLEYFVGGSDTPIVNPSGPQAGVDRISIWLRCTDRKNRPGPEQFQHVDLKARVLIRNSRL